jgi:hypothetical protein
MLRRRNLILAAVLGGVVVLAVGLRLSASRIVWSRIASAVQERYGLELEVDEVSLALLSGGATLRGLRITDDGKPLIEAERVELSASLRDVFAGSYDLRRLVVTRPVVHVVVEQGESTNFSRIFGRRKPLTRPAHLVVLREARVTDGRCVLDDAWTDPEHPVHLTFEELAVRIDELQVSGTPGSSEIGDFRLDALLVHKESPARISVVGWAPPRERPLTVAVHAAITGLELGQISQYVSDRTRSALGGDLIHLAGSMRTRRGVIEDGALAAEVVGKGVELPLRFGGTTSDVVFDGDSKLAALFHLPFARLGHLGDVALTSTWGATVDIGSGIVGAGASAAEAVVGTLGGMLRLDPLGALEAAGSGVQGGAQALGGGVAGAFRRIFGGEESAEHAAKAEAQQERKFAALHAKCRRAMLEAALESAAHSSSARKRRIEAELEAAPPANATVTRASGGAGQVGGE